MATFNLEEFKSALANGGARPNQFAVILSYPGFVQSASQALARGPLLINVAELPGQTVNPAVVQYRGREVKFVGDRIFAPWTITVLNDSAMTVRTAIEQWMRGMEDYASKSAESLSPADYQRDLTVNQLDRNGTVLKSYILKGAFPVDLSPVALDFGANDQISQFTCTWQYQYFETGSSSANAAGDASAGVIDFGGNNLL